MEHKKLTTVELDKYKLLVSESDVINNLLLKLGNKLATIDNSVQIIELKHLQYTKYDSINYCNDLNSQYTKQLVSLFIFKLMFKFNFFVFIFSFNLKEILKQEFSQIQRKKEEALFLKNGINKRAATVSDFLVK